MADFGGIDANALQRLSTGGRLTFETTFSNKTLFITEVGQTGHHTCFRV